MCVSCVSMCVWYVCGMCVCMHACGACVHVCSYMIKAQRTPPPHTLLLLHRHTHLRLIEELNGNGQSPLLPSTETWPIGPAHLDISFVVQVNLKGGEGGEAGGGEARGGEGSGGKGRGGEGRQGEGRGGKRAGIED